MRHLSSKNLLYIFLKRLILTFLHPIITLSSLSTISLPLPHLHPSPLPLPHLLSLTPSPHLLPFPLPHPLPSTSTSLPPHPFPLPHPLPLPQVKMFNDRRLDDRRAQPLFHHFTTAVDTENIKYVFQAVKDTILRKNIGLLMLH